MIIKHVLADGQKVDDIQGRMITINDKTEKAYRLLIQKEQENEIE